MILHLVPSPSFHSEGRASEAASVDAPSTETEVETIFGQRSVGGDSMHDWVGIFLIVTMILGAIGFGGYALFHAATWPGALALLVSLSLVSFVFQYRKRCQPR